LLHLRRRLVSAAGAGRKGTAFGHMWQRAAHEEHMEQDQKRGEKQATEDRQDQHGLDSVTGDQMAHAEEEVTHPISPVQPGSMPRAEDDAESMARSPEFNDRPGSGKHRHGQPD
jgi:hypothetical protein